jgi:protein SCO1/2
MMRPHRRRALACALVSGAAFMAFVTAGSPVVSAQMTGAPSPGYAQTAGMPASAVPAPLREIGFDQNLDRPLPLDAEFVDEEGRPVRLGAYFTSKPVVLAFVYYDCPMLCTLVLNALTATLDTLSLQTGRDFDVVAISFDPRETPALAARRKTEALQRYKASTAAGTPEIAAGWHFLTGRQDDITRVTKAAGFRYVWDAETKQFAHPTGIIVVTPDGRPARYLFGLEYGPRDVRLALLEASQGRVGSRVDSLLLYCYHYDPMTGRYGLVVMRALRIAGAATVLAIGAFIMVMVARDKSSKAPRGPKGSSSDGRGQGR